MGKPESGQNPEINNVVEIVALFLAGRIKREGLSEDNQSVLSFYLSLMDEDPKFAARVNAVKKQLTTDGQRTSLFSPEEMAKLSKGRRRKRKKPVYARQLGFWTTEPTQTHPPGEILDPEANLAKLARKANHPFYQGKRSPFRDEIRQKRMALRNQIGLPVARGKDPHINDDFYKYLVKKIYRQGVFGIFEEYDAVLDTVPEQLELKIQQVAELIDQLLNHGLNMRQRYQTYHDFVKEYQDFWGISPTATNNMRR